MATTIRLSRAGTKKKPFYHIHVTDSRDPRDGRYITRLGTYHPKSADEGKQLNLDVDAAQKWVAKGAQMSETVRQLLSRASK